MSKKNKTQGIDNNVNNTALNGDLWSGINELGVDCVNNTALHTILVPEYALHMKNNRLSGLKTKITSPKV